MLGARMARLDVKPILLLIGIALFAGCLTPPERVPPRDAGVDAVSDEPDVGGVDDVTLAEDLLDHDAPPPCGGCAGELVCHVDTGSCVECVTGADCASGVCEPVSTTCVDCIDPSSCVSASASRCADNFECTSCLVDDDCAHISDRTACANGTCVACTATNDTGCDGNACNPRTLTCTSTPIRSLETCEPCVTDNECATGWFCVVMEFDTQVRHNGESGYCLRVLDQSPCEPGTRVTTMSQLPSIDDPTIRSFCSPRQNLTTCEALLDWRKDCETDDDCGAEPGDARCAELDGLSEKLCTYPCQDPSDCLDSAVCAGADHFCGVP